MRRVVGVAIAASAITLAGCPKVGIMDDGSSVSWGPSNDGQLLSGAQLPRRGTGFYMPPEWSTRGNHFGTDEMIQLIVWTGRQLDVQEPGLAVGIADLSPRGGGPSQWHRSHQTGRDCDIMFFAREAGGGPIRLTEMVRFDDAGRAVLSDGRQVLFDVRRNWLLVRTLLENPVARIQFLFISDGLKQLLLDHAEQIGEPESLIEYAGWVLGQPMGALPHDDHLHLRIYCSPDDLAAGCRDRGSQRWYKRDAKEFVVPRSASAPVSRVGADLGRLPAMLSLSSIPFRGFVPR
ncbi:MAG TPA: penicillin-insensitive murein endopeptidase [Kofleriaceae bacterium]|jgi:penicillin-insensitive murein endopeptidase|nr:penicillin-insensitive murein endopeptidase [Kofleriaceae bacterium]